jgi:hypothetical protein
LTCREAGGRCLLAKADVAIEEEIADLVERTVKSSEGLISRSTMPGFHWMTKRIRTDQKMRGQFLAIHPLGRFGRVEEVAAAVVYLCSPKAGFTTGVALPLDGGASA